ncbi:MFS transporter [Candidatus Parcubacteria bacterium]|nr:MFS transporter [Candidatus Parcubacteria bacterium]
MQSIQGFAFSLIGIFIPIYLITLGYSVQIAILYYIFHYSFLLFFSFFVLTIARKIGLIQTITLRLPFLFTYLIFLYLLESTQIPIIIIAFFSGLESALYWIPSHIIFSRNTSSENIGTQTGKLFALPQIAGIFGPFIGGFTAVTFGFKPLLAIVFLFILLSIIPLLILKNKNKNFYNKPNKLKLSTSKKLFKNYKKYFFLEIFDNMAEEVGAIIWPIFVFQNLNSIQSVGYVGTITGLCGAIFTLLIGKFSDKFNKKKLIKIASLLLIFNWSVMYFANNALLIYIFTIFSGFFFTLLVVPYSAIFYRISHKENSDNFFVWREIPIGIGRILILLIALVLVSNLKLLFPIAGLAYIYFLFL